MERLSWWFKIIGLVIFLAVCGLNLTYAASNPQVVKQSRIAAVKARSSVRAARKRTKLEEAENRAEAAEARAMEAEATAAKAAKDAKAAQDLAAQAMEQLRKVNEETARLQELLARTEQPVKVIAESKAMPDKADKQPTTDVSPSPVASKIAGNQDQVGKPLEGVMTTLSKIPVKIYGNILLSTNYLDRGSNNNDLPTVALKAGVSDQNHQNFNMTARQTRFGLRYEGKVFNNATLIGVLEIDFFGGKPASSVGVGFDLLRLRLGYGRIDWDKDSIEIGQDNTVFSPLNPTTLASFAVASAFAGNMFNRFLQVRYEHRENIGKSKIIFDSEVLDPNAGDNIGNTPARVIGLGERGSIPAFDSRIGFARSTYGKETSAGVSGHYSRLLGVPGNPMGTLVRSPIDSYGVSGDFNVWLTSGLRVTGEVFHGRALGIFGGGILQNSVVINGRARGINSSGGWAELHGELKKFSANFGYGIEENRDEDLLVGMRKRNQTYMINGRYQFTPNFAFAVEYRQIQTDFFKQAFANQKLNWANLSLLYSF